MPNSSFTGRVSFVVLIVTGVIIVWGILSFLTPHETLSQNLENNSFFKPSSIDSHPDVKNAVVKTLALTTQENSGESFMFVNGDANPAISIRPGEIQRWRVINNSSNNFFNLSVPGLTFYIISRDNLPTTIPVSVSEELLAPGDRIEMLIQGPGWGGYDVINSFNTNGQKIMTLKSEGFPTFNSSLPSSLVPNYDLRNAKVSGSKSFSITNIESGLLQDSPVRKTVEEWTIINNTSELVPFSTPNNFFQVMEINGEPIERYGYDTVFTAPPNGIVKIRVQ